MKTLYHGSNIKLHKCDKLEPNSPVSNYGTDNEGEKYVYATTDVVYAIIRSGNFKNHENEILMREEYYRDDLGQVWFELCECEKGAFEKLFNCKGWIYVINNDSNNWERGKLENEFIATENVKWNRRKRIPNVLYTIETLEYLGQCNEWKRNEWSEDVAKIKLIRYGTDEWYEYWKKLEEDGCVGGIEGYRKRRIDRLKRRDELNDELNDDELNNDELNNDELNNVKD